MMTKTKKIVIKTDKAPQALGPYSAGIKYANLIFTAGQLGIDPQTNDLVSGGIEAETRQAIMNIKSILEEANSAIDNVLKTTVFLRDINDFAKMNSVYAEFFIDNPPARSAFQVAALPKGASVEIETIASIAD